MKVLHSARPRSTSRASEPRLLPARCKASMACAISKPVLQYRKLHAQAKAHVSASAVAKSSIADMAKTPSGHSSRATWSVQKGTARKYDIIIGTATALTQESGYGFDRRSDNVRSSCTTPSGPTHLPLLATSSLSSFWPSLGKNQDRCHAEQVRQVAIDCNWTNGTG